MAAALSSSVCVLLAVLPLPPVEAAEPGTFFWSRRQIGPVTLPPDPFGPQDYTPKNDMANIGPSAKQRGGQVEVIDRRKVSKPTRKNFKDGYVVIIDGWRLTTSVMALVTYSKVMNEAYPHLHPCYSDFWTTAYRWFYRYYKSLPDWAFGRGTFIDTHKVWRKRYWYMDRMVPQVLRPFLIELCVDPATFKKEEWVWRKFVRYTQPQWGKFFIYPSKVFNNYKSMRPDETWEYVDDSTRSKSLS
ncbi:uncharacterized protein LOC118280693 [Spodoptera frugiperda]|uniref:Uncharacterized protein LOC118280693 n=1 Tax=Spodoptera frugiperda TaxID=7108 RepID=A0A9R0DJE5_SPOFR|nr:uncharacterized protein LOC118280693 [Spodoptera frugiperda]